MKQIGTVARLQVQRGPLKTGSSPRRVYDPAPLLPVDELQVEAAGVSSGGFVDVHHRDHPLSRNQQTNGVSIGFTSHYLVMRGHFGEHLTDGIAGENILIDTDHPLTEAELAGGLVIEGADRVRLTAIIVAEPCVEFSRFAARSLDEDGRVTEALQRLRGGLRGFYASLDGEPGSIRVGDRCLIGTR